MTHRHERVHARMRTTLLTSVTKKTNLWTHTRTHGSCWSYPDTLMLTHVAAFTSLRLTVCVSQGDQLPNEREDSSYGVDTTTTSVSTVHPLFSPSFHLSPPLHTHHILQQLSFASFPLCPLPCLSSLELSSCLNTQRWKLKTNAPLTLLSLPSSLPVSLHQTLYLLPARSLPLFHLNTAHFYLSWYLVAAAL